MLKCADAGQVLKLNELKVPLGVESEQDLMVFWMYSIHLSSSIEDISDAQEY